VALRTFVALPVGRGPRRRLAARARRLSEADPGVRAVAEPDLHLTLHFLGATEEGDVGRVVAALAGVAEAAAPVPVRYEGLGAFPSPARARVLWAGVVETHGAGSLAALARLVSQSMGGLGFPAEDRPYRAHVTLGRTRGDRPRDVRRLLGAPAPDAYGTETLSDLALMVSAPEPGGPRYRALARFRLARRDEGPRRRGTPAP
jgi:2'-5' RNA ligase